MTYSVKNIPVFLEQFSNFFFWIFNGRLSEKMILKQNQTPQTQENKQKNPQQTNTKTTTKTSLPCSKKKKKTKKEKGTQEIP